MREHFFRHHVLRLSVTVYFSVAHGKQIIGVPRSEIQIMQYHDNRRMLTLVEMLQKFEHLQLMREVEICCRLVEQNNSRLLSERHSNPDPLPLPAG